MEGFRILCAKSFVIHGPPLIVEGRSIQMPVISVVDAARSFQPRATYGSTVVQQAAICTNSRRFLKRAVLQRPYSPSVSLSWNKTDKKTTTRVLYRLVLYFSFVALEENHSETVRSHEKT